MERPLSIREEANALTCLAFRNGYIEELHAGKYSELLERQELSRITDAEMKKLMIQSSAALAKILELKETDPEAYWRKIKKFHDAYCRHWDK